MNAYRRFVEGIGGTAAFSWIGPHVVTPIDRLMRGRMPIPSTLGTGLTVLHLKTVGRRSRRDRTSSLLYVDADGGFVVAGTNFGTEHHPAWTYNLDESPWARVALDRGREVDVVSRRATPDERDRYWPSLVAMWPPYARYRSRASHRDVRMYVLEPMSSAHR